MKKSTKQLLFERMNTIGGMPLISESKIVLSERLEEIDQDVNLLYDKYFKNDIEKFNQTKEISFGMFNPATGSTSILKTEASVKAHGMNPCDITINYGKNAYSPYQQDIYLSANMSAVRVIKDAGNLENALEDILISKHRSFKNELTEKKIKGSIHHELLHWLDDTFHNQHIKKYSKVATEIGVDKTLKGKDVNTTKFEIQGQMGNIKQFKNNTPDRVYNFLSFNEFIKSVPTLNHIYNTIGDSEKIEWKRNLLTRMHRENLLGDNMKLK